MRAIPSVIAGGGWWVLRQVEMIPLAAAFMATFAVLIGVVALAGRSYYATWHTGPVLIERGLSPRTIQ